MMFLTFTSILKKLETCFVVVTFILLRNKSLFAKVVQTLSTYTPSTLKLVCV